VNWTKRRNLMALKRQFQLQTALLACGLAAVLSAALAGCSSSGLDNLNNTLPSSVALPAAAPERPVDAPAFPAVHDMPPPRPNVTLTAEEQVKLEDDLAALKTRQDIAAGTTPAAVKKRAPPLPAAPRVIPAASSNTIY
jgi:hypothetical protein